MNDPPEELSARLREAEARLAANNAGLTSFHFAATTLMGSAFEEPETLLDTVLGLGCHLIGVERGAVYVRGEESGSFELRSVRGDGAPKGLRVPVSGRMIEHAVRGKSMVFCPDAALLRADLSMQDDLAKFLGRSFAVTPLVVSGETAGLLCLAGKAGEAKLNDDDRRFLTAYSGLASSAVHSGELMVELKAKERLEREMEIARTIQTSLLPLPVTLSNWEIAARMVPAERVGGDFHDFHRCEGGFWLGVGDVSSHGVTPGLIMMMVQSIFSTLVSTKAESRPRELLTLLNRVVYDNIHARLRVDDYVTLVIGRCFADGRFVHAGAHLDILVLRASDGRVDRFPTGGIWVGLSPEIAEDTTESELRLEPGDVMVLYTDGITEARSPAGELYESERLAELLQKLRHAPVQNLRDRVFEDVDTWALEQDDDRTLVVVKYKGGA